MDKRAYLFILILLILALPLSRPLQVGATHVFLAKEDVYEFLESAFLAQVSLSERGRSMAEVEEALDPFFKDGYKDEFIKENIVKENGEYWAYGSDFSRYYIPFYTFSEKTKIISIEDRIVVVEYFPASEEGPVGYKSHYKGIELEMVNGSWKASTYWEDDLPEEVITKAYTSLNTNESLKKSQMEWAGNIIKPEVINPFDHVLTNKEDSDNGKPLFIYLGNGIFGLGPNIVH